MPEETKKLSYEHYKCEVAVPITLKVPIFLEPAVIAKKPKCVTKNGYKLDAALDETESMLDAQP